VTQQTDANLLHRMMQCLATKNENENNVQINPKILSLVYTMTNEILMFKNESKYVYVF